MPTGQFHRIDIYVDDVHHVLSATLVRNVQTDAESITPLSVGPFDSPTECLERALETLDKQLTLW